MAAEQNPIHEDDRKLFVGGLPQVNWKPLKNSHPQLTDGGLLPYYVDVQMF